MAEKKGGLIKGLFTRAKNVLLSDGTTDVDTEFSNIEAYSSTPKKVGVFNNEIVYRQTIQLTGQSIQAGVDTVIATGFSWKGIIDISGVIATTDGSVIKLGHYYQLGSGTTYSTVYINGDNLRILSSSAANAVCITVLYYNA